MGRYKPKPSDLSRAAMETLLQIRDGKDIADKDTAVHLREIDGRFPGLIKFGPPMRNATALFSIRATPKGHILIDAYLDEQKVKLRPVEVTTELAPEEATTHG